MDKVKEAVVRTINAAAYVTSVFLLTAPLVAGADSAASKPQMLAQANTDKGNSSRPSIEETKKFIDEKLKAYGKEAASKFVVYNLKWSWNGSVFTYSREAGEKNPPPGKRNDWSTTYRIDLAKIEKADSDRPEIITLACKYNQSCVQYTSSRNDVETEQGSTEYAYISVYDHEQRDKLTRAFNHLINLIEGSKPKELF